MCLPPRRHRRLVVSCACLVVTLPFLALAPAALAQLPVPVPVSLFSPDPAGGAAAGLPDDAYLVRLDADGLARARDLMLGGSPVSMPLPVAQGAVLDVVLDAVAPTGRGYSLAGYLADTVPLPGEPRAEVVRLTVHGSDIVGEIVSRFGGWTLFGEVGPNGVVVSPHVRPPTHRAPDAVLPRDPPIREAHRPTWAEPPYHADILVVILRSVVDRLGSVRRARALADNWVQSTNAALAGSRVPTRLRLVAALPAHRSDPYRSEKLIRTLTHLRASADDEYDDGTRPDPHGLFDWVLLAREEHRADLVHLIADEVRPYRDEPCGTAYLGTPAWSWALDGINEPFTLPSTGFAASRRDCGFTTFAHEVGHNFGIDHDRYQVRREALECSQRNPECSYGLADYDPSYVFGYVNQARFRRGSPGRVWPPRRDAWGTIMAYEWVQCGDWGFYCWEIPLFSSPRWSFLGDPGGVSGAHRSARIDGPADAARVFREFSSLTTHNLRANCLRNGWRLNLQTWTGDFVRAEHGGGGRVIANRSRPLTQETLIVDADFPGCVEHGSVISLRATDGSYLRAVDGGGGLVDSRGVRPGTWERFLVERVEEPDGLVGPVDDIALRSADGRYLRVRYRERSRPLRAEGSTVGPWERFVITARRP